MIKSMTGFASVTREDELATIGVTIRSVNHRYLDLHLRVPPACSEVEARLRGQAQRRVARGRIEVTVTLQLTHTPPKDIEINEQILASLADALDRARERGLVVGALTVSDLLRLPQAITIRERPESDGAATLVRVGERVVEVVDQALVELDAMRAREGEHLRADLDARRSNVGQLVDRIAAAAEEGRAMFETRLAARVREITADLQLDAAAVAQEVVRTAARSDIDEELVRLRGHLAHWVAIADSPEPCGRKLDFLLQEMNREVNTIGSKAEGVAVPELVVAAKAELERLREQVQNVE